MPRYVMALAALLLLSALAVIFLPMWLPQPPRGRGALESIPVNMTQMQAVLAQIRQVADQINAPLSVVVALASLYYSRRGYQVQKQRAERE